MKSVLAVIGAIVVLFVLAMFAVCSIGDDDDESLNRQAVVLGLPASPPILLVSHERDRCYEDCDDWGGGSDGNTGYDGEGGRSGDQGDGDGQCRNFCNITVPSPVESSPRLAKPSQALPGPALAARLYPQSLFPVPTPGGVQKFVLATIEAGIGLGRLFANATIDFVSSIMVGVAAR